MKKISLLFAAMLTLALVFTSCQQPAASDPDMTLDDLKETDWMLGTWKTNVDLYQYDISIEGDSLSEKMKELFLSYLPSQQEFAAGLKEDFESTFVITPNNIEVFKETFENEIKKAGTKTVSENGVSGEASTGITLSKNKDVITMNLSESLQITES